MTATVCVTIVSHVFGHINPEGLEYFIPPAGHSALKMPCPFLSQAPLCEHSEQAANPSQWGVLPQNHRVRAAWSTHCPRGPS